MRPINLEMTAFGSYAEKTTVPFCSLKHGLYLVTGDTGAGKSTIFDAIIFALYGVASRSEKKPEMLHSDFVSKAVDTIVKLRFEQGGKEYTVQRTIHYRKKQKAKDEYSNPIVKAVLWEPDREAESANAKNSREEKTEFLRQKKEEISAIEDKIKDTDKIDVEVESLKRRLNDIHDLQENLSEKQRIKDTVGDIRRLEVDLKKEKTTLLRLTEEARDASEKSQDIYKRFLSGQAGILAEDLQLKLNETGTAVCPVCGSVLSSNHIHQLASLSENTPKQEDFESAKMDAERTEKKRSDQDSKVNGLSERLRERKDGLIKSVRDWLSSLQALVLEPDLVSDTIWMKPFPEDAEEAWSRISSDSLLEEAESYLDLIEKETDSQYKTAEKTKKKRENNIGILLKWGTEAEKIERSIKEYDRKEQEQLKVAEKYKGVEEEIKKQLDFDTKELANKKLEKLQQREIFLQGQIEDHKKTLKTASQQFNNSDGQLKSENGRMPGLEEGKNTAEYSLKNILIEAVYETTEEKQKEANKCVLEKSLAKQSLAIIPKIREVDEFLRSHPGYKNVILESHPELAFSRLNGQILLSRKKEFLGFSERSYILAEYLGNGNDLLKKLSSKAKELGCTPDDVVDATCMAVTAA